MTEVENRNDPVMVPQDAIMEVKKLKVSSLAWDEKKKILKEFWEVVWDDYQVGDYIDAMDTISKWCLA